MRRPADLQRIDPNRLGDVLELGEPKIAHRHLEPPPDLPVGLLGKTDRARLGDPFQARGDIDAVAHEIAVTLLDDVADMDADAKFDSPILGHSGVALDEAVLHFDRAAHRIDHAAELDDRAVAGALDDAAVMGGDGGVDEIAAEAPKPREGAILVLTGEPAVADDVGHQDRGEFPGLSHSSGSPALRRPSNSGGKFGAWSISHLTVSSGLRRLPSARAVFASSVLLSSA